jgi:uncharacterized RDD family membrane protein YckC
VTGPPAGATPALPASDPSGTAGTPGIRRRLACFVYESVLLFGVLVIAGLLYSVLTDQRHALAGRTGLLAFLVAVAGVYFVGFWWRHGQTLAMRTWHVRIVDALGQNPSLGRSVARYLLSWLWFLPALLVLSAVDIRGIGSSLIAFVVLAAGVLTYALLARLHPERQFVHDAICGTRLVTSRPAPKQPLPT